MSIKKAKPIAKKAIEKKWNEGESERQLSANIADLDSGVAPVKRNNIVIIGNNQIELKPIGKLASLLRFTDAHKHLLPEIDAAEKDAQLEKAEYVIIRNTIWVLAGGSKLNYNTFDALTSYAEEGDVSVGELSIVYLHASHINFYECFTGNIKTVNMLFATQITTNQLELKNCGIYSGQFRGASVKIKNSIVKDVAITSAKTRIVNTKIQAHHINTNGEVDLEGYVTSLTTTSGRMRSFPGAVRNVIIRPNHHLARHEFVIPHVFTNARNDTKFDISIINRIDYGVFNGVSPVNFVRANRCDLVLDGYYIAATDLELTYDRFKNEINGSPNALCCPTQSDETYLATIRALRDKAIGDGESSRYLPDSTNRLENGLILGFIEQLRSRSNLYKQLDFLTDKG